MLPVITWPWFLAGLQNIPSHATARQNNCMKSSLKSISHGSPGLPCPLCVVVFDIVCRFDLCLMAAIILLSVRPVRVHSGWDDVRLPDPSTAAAELCPPGTLTHSSRQREFFSMSELRWMIFKVWIKSAEREQSPYNTLGPKQNALSLHPQFGTLGQQMLFVF